MFRTLLSATLVMMFSAHSYGQTPGDGQAMNPVGAWHVTVTPAPPRLPFNGLQVYNFGGTTTTSNVACNAIVPSPSGLQCQDGYGVWKGLGQHQFLQTFLIQAFDPTGEHFGFIKVRGLFTMEGKNNFAGRNEVFLLLGVDAANPDAVIPLGLETVEGLRVLAEAPE